MTSMLIEDVVEKYIDLEVKQIFPRNQGISLKFWINFCIFSQAFKTEIFGETEKYGK